MKVQTETVIVGAGPCGLFQVFELGILGIRTPHIVDSLPQTGGQCTMLYPDKPIYDIPAIPVCSGEELVERLETQIAPFDPQFHLGQTVDELEAVDRRFRLKTSQGTEFNAGAVIIAGGLGSFAPRLLRVPGAKKFEGENLHYRVPDKTQFRDKRLVILGGGDSALDWALDLHGLASSVTLIHRREQFRAQPASVERFRALAQAEPTATLLIGQVKGLVEQSGQLTGIKVNLGENPGKEKSGGERRDVAFDELLVFYGLRPELGPIAEWGLTLDKKHIEVNTTTFETNQPGIFAVGDINTYPGKKKLILSGFHEAALAAFGVHKHLYPEVKQHLQYSTTSSAIHERLGVSGTLT